MRNQPPNVFISSTMRDFSDLRAQLHRFVKELGWCPVMAERESFPIDGTQTPAENSRANARENADIFVMIVGARYGSIDPETNKSITHLELLEARSRGVPAYVFVNRDVLAQLDVWKSNPQADYPDVVDTPRLFEFIASLREDDGVWTMPFATLEDITTNLRHQFSYLVQDALVLRQRTHGQDRLLDELEGEALSVALRRDQHWEDRLFGLVLKTELDRLAPLRREIEHQFAGSEVRRISGTELVPWVQDRLHELSELARTATTILNDYLPQARGADGEPGDPFELAAAARRLAQVWRDSSRWTLRCRSVRVDSSAQRLIDALADGNANMLEEVWEFGHTVIPRLDAAIAAHVTGDDPQVVTMTLTLGLPVLTRSTKRSPATSWTQHLRRSLT